MLGKKMRVKKEAGRILHANGAVGLKCMVMDKCHDTVGL
jgi:hypothetical protein